MKWQLWWRSWVNNGFPDFFCLSRIGCEFHAFAEISFPFTANSREFSSIRAEENQSERPRCGVQAVSHGKLGHYLSKHPRRKVRALAAILRVAESLDRSHAQTVTGLVLHDRGDDDLLQVRTSGDAELELWAAARHAAPFERLTGKPLRIEVSRLAS